MVIDPIAWLAVANAREPRREGRTPWFDGTTAPSRIGWYERHFTDSVIAGPFRHYWNGSAWLVHPGSAPHHRQVGDYPCWRGLTSEAVGDAFNDTTLIRAAMLLGPGFKRKGQRSMRWSTTVPSGRTSCEAARQRCGSK